MKRVSEGWGWYDTTEDIDGWINHKKVDSEDRDGRGSFHYSAKKKTRGSSRYSTKKKTAMAIFEADSEDRDGWGSSRYSTKKKTAMAIFEADSEDRDGWGSSRYSTKKKTAMAVSEADSEDRDGWGSSRYSTKKKTAMAVSEADSEDRDGWGSSRYSTKKKTAMAVSEADSEDRDGWGSSRYSTKKKTAMAVSEANSEDRDGWGSSRYSTMKETAMAVFEADSVDRDGWGSSHYSTKKETAMAVFEADSEDRDGWGSSRYSTKMKTAMGVFDFDTLDCLVCMEPLSSQIIQDRFCTPPHIHTTQQRLSNKAILEDTDGCDNSDSSRQKKSRSSTLLAVFDFDTLDCLVCMEPLSSQIIQCCNGHYVCQPCIAKINGKCPTCLEPIGKIRNLGLEKIIESLKVQCEFARLGCEEMLQYKAKKLHEQDCPHRPHDCPLDGCGFRGHLKDFSLHFMKLHEAQTVHFKYAQWFSVLIKPYYHYLLLKSEDDKLFIFHNQKLVLQGINALYLAVLHTAQGALLHNYCIVAKTGTNKVCLESRAVPCSSFSFPCSPLSVHTVEHSSIDLLLVPSGSIASLTVELYICRIGESISSWS